MRKWKEMGPLGPVERILGPWPKEEEEERGQAHWALEIKGDRKNACMAKCA
jgi:hypothetical protein